MAVECKRHEKTLWGRSINTIASALMPWKRNGTAMQSGAVLSWRPFSNLQCDIHTRRQHSFATVFRWLCHCAHFRNPWQHWPMARKLCMLHESAMSRLSRIQHDVPCDATAASLPCSRSHRVLTANLTNLNKLGCEITRFCTLSHTFLLFYSSAQIDTRGPIANFTWRQWRIIECT